MTEHVFPADIPDAITEACKALALAAHRLLGCKGASRADFRWDDEQGVEGLFLLEVNTQPGMTPLSLVPRTGAAFGHGLSDARPGDRRRGDARGGAMSRTIKRGAPPKRPQPRRKQPVRKVTLLDRLVGALPVSEATLRRIATWTIMGGVGAAAVALAVLVGVPGMIGGALAEAAGARGVPRRADRDHRPEADGPDERLRGRAGPEVDRDAAGRSRFGPRPAAALWLDRRRARLQATARYLAGRHRRASASRRVAGQWPAHADRREGRAARPRQPGRDPQFAARHRPRRGPAGGQLHRAPRRRTRTETARDRGDMGRQPEGGT